MSSATDLVTVDLIREKETKNKVRFVEASGEDKLGTIYVPKATHAKLGNPDRLTMSIAPAVAVAQAA